MIKINQLGFLLALAMPFQDSYAESYLEAYKNAGSICNEKEAYPLLNDYSKWLNNPDLVPDIRLRFEALLSDGCNDGLMVLLHSKTQLNAGKVGRYYQRCGKVLPLLEKSLTQLKKDYPHELEETYRLLATCSAVEKRPVSEIISWYKLALTKKPDSIDLHLSLAGLYGQDGQIQKSNALVLNLLKNELPPRSISYAYLILGDNALLQNNPQNAVTYFKNAYDLDFKSTKTANPFTLARIAKAYDKFDQKQALVYWMKLKKMRDNPNLVYRLDAETEKLLNKKTASDISNKKQAKYFLGWDLSYKKEFKKLGIDEYDNARKAFSTKKHMKLDDIDQDKIKSAVMIDSLAMHYFGYRISFLFYQTADNKFFERTYEEKNFRQKEVRIDSSGYIQMLNVLRLLKQQKLSKKYDTFSGYSSAISLFENNEARQILIPQDLTGKILSETKVIKKTTDE
jgi:hypothetical protein